jgi:ribosome-binding factor A
MSQRTEKVESLSQQVVATGLLDQLGGDMARVTVTRVDVSPDLRHAIVWIGIVASGADQTQLFERVDELRPDLQRDVAERLTTKFVPRLSLKLDTGGEYAAQMERLLNNL